MKGTSSCCRLLLLLLLVAAATAAADVCRSDQFKCANGRCIRDVLRCDGGNDCGHDSDDSDERDCCKGDHFVCGDGRCIHKRNECDGWTHCGDWSDEKHCACRSDQFKCPETFRCIDEELRCDGVFNCGDDSDERDCCTGDHFVCGDGRCIHKRNECDSRNNCGDWSDEKHCVCRSDQFKCAYTGLCIDGARRCNGRRNDCGAYSGDNSDEYGCANWRHGLAIFVIGMRRLDRFVLVHDCSLIMKSREDCAPKNPDAVQHFHNLGATELQLTQLQAYTEYEVCVYAYNEGRQNKKCEVFETLPEEVSWPVEELTSSTTSTSISLRWRKPCPPMAAISGYRVTVTYYVQASECSDSAAHFCHTIKELQPERTYNIEVQSCTADDNRACSAAMATAVTTEPAVSCTAEELQCGALCLPLSARCNGASERDDGEDEPPSQTAVVPAVLVPGAAVPAAVVPGTAVPGAAVPAVLVPGAAVPAAVVP
ncbi:atrial natriuretic peptide-converting enzyme, partial [Hyalella azteca]|uniref:Atrial natriuretic peptide-converting enzyme n=1 Tax=Hyalella azteca TaxID=294128 RepID=A0A8B7NSY4_HYAAZ